MGEKVRDNINVEIRTLGRAFKEENKLQRGEQVMIFPVLGLAEVNIEKMT